MKKQILNTLFIAVFGMMLVACGGAEKTAEGEAETSKQTETTKAPVDTKKMVQAYIDLKDALVNSDVGTAKISASKLMRKAEGEIKTTAEAIKTTDDLAVQRQHFSKVSELVYASVKESAPITLYKQFCPMAFDNTGAFWLSEEKEIKNPYFGDEMMTCGEVQETLAAK